MDRASLSGFSSAGWIFFWSNYSDLTRPHPKWWFSKGNPLISGKSRLVKYYNLTRFSWCPRHCFFTGSPIFDTTFIENGCFMGDFAGITDNFTIPVSWFKVVGFHRERSGWKIGKITGILTTTPQSYVYPPRNSRPYDQGL